jgi:hypothetical protein
MHHQNPLYDERTPLGKFVAIITIALLAVAGAVIQCNEKANREDAVTGFQTDNFLVLSLFEDDRVVRERLLSAAKGKFDEDHPVASFKEEKGERRLYKLPKLETGDLPSPAFAQKMPPAFHGDSANWSVIYAVFKAPDALKKMKRWAKDNGYSGHDFDLEWSNKKETFTSSVLFEKKGSTVSLVGFYKSDSRLYLWTGSRVYDVSKGLTSEAGGASGEKYYKEYIKWLEGLSE